MQPCCELIYWYHELLTPHLLCFVLSQEVHEALLSVEAEAERMFANERRLMDADSQERDRLYARAQQVCISAAAQAIASNQFLGVW